jgi:predicted transcriptional regulator
MNEHEVRMKITRILIESGFSVSRQKIIIKHLLKTLDFCIKDGAGMRQNKLEL